MPSETTVPPFSSRRSMPTNLATLVVSFVITVLIGLRCREWGTAGANGALHHSVIEGVGEGRGSTWHGEDGGAPNRVMKFLRERKGSKSEVFGGPAFRLYHDTGMLNPNILELAGVPVEKRAELQEAFEHRWAEFSRDFESRAELIEPGDGEEHLGTYRIAGSAAIADAFRKSLEDEISPYAGRGGAEILLKYLDRESHFAGLGRYDVEMKLSEIDSMGERVRAVHYEVTDPKSGRRLEKGGTSLPLGYWMRFGDAFVWGEQ